MANSIEVKNIDAGYGSVKVLHSVSIDVQDGETVVILGSNGNGKSTLIKCITGILAPSAGEIILKLDGQEIDLIGKKPEEIVELGISLVPEGRRLFPSLTVEENLRHHKMRAQSGEVWRSTWRSQCVTFAAGL